MGPAISGTLNSGYTAVLPCLIWGDIWEEAGFCAPGVVLGRTEAGTEPCIYKHTLGLRPSAPGDPEEPGSGS